MLPSNYMPNYEATTKKLTWDTEGTQLKVVTHFRDLGAHVAMDSRNAASTTTRRIQKATTKVKRLDWLPVSTAGKPPPSPPPYYRLPCMAQRLGKDPREPHKH